MHGTLLDDGPGKPLATARWRSIIDLVTDRRYVTLAELQTATGVSLSTVHRDLAHLAHTGAIRRVRGGAASPTQPPDELDDLRRQLTALARNLQPGRLAAVRRLLLQALTACERLQHRTPPAAVE